MRRACGYAAAALLLGMCSQARAEGGRAMGYRPHGVQMSAGSAVAAKRTMLRGTSTASLPTRWDSRDYGWISRVKNQGTVGACWSFAACAVIETQLLKTGRGEWDLSEKNMVNLNGWSIGFNEGGNNYMATAYLLRWAGAVAETNDVYRSSPGRWTSSPSLVPAVRVQNVVWVPGRTSASDNATLKAAVMEYGAVATSIHWDTDYESSDSYYCDSQQVCNHAITAIGWDDDYPAGNFKSVPDGDGAWLIKNSWGAAYGDGGYYWVSYHDTTFAVEEGAVFIPAASDENYDAVYGYDILGAVDVTSENDSNTMEAAVFTSAWNEEIAAVGVYSSIANNPYEVSVYTNVTRTTSTNRPNPLRGGAIAVTTSGTIAKMGYTTIHLPHAVKIADGTNFAVVYKQTGSKRAHVYCCSATDEYGTYVDAHPVAGNTYWGSAVWGSTSWTDLYARRRIACLKAYMRSTVAAGGRPAEFEDGGEALTWLAATNATLFAETGETFGASAGIVGANGRTLWTSWLAGFDPASADDGDFEVSISVSNNVPCLVWRPNLGSSARTYTVYGAESLSPQSWTRVDDLATTKARFFKVEVSR